MAGPLFVLVLLRRLAARPLAGRVVGLLARWAPATFAVYLAHAFFIVLVSRAVQHLPVDSTHWLAVAGTWLAALAASALLGALARVLPLPAVVRLALGLPRARGRLRPARGAEG